MATISRNTRLFKYFMSVNFALGLKNVGKVKSEKLKRVCEARSHKRDPT